MCSFYALTTTLNIFAEEPMSLDFTDKTVLVTGGTRGIGRAIVEAFAEAGARVAFTYRSSTEEAEALQQALEDGGTETLVFQGDAADAEAWIAECAASRDLREGLRAKREGRPPTFEGR